MSHSITWATVDSWAVNVATTSVCSSLTQVPFKKIFGKYNHVKILLIEYFEEADEQF